MARRLLPFPIGIVISASLFFLLALSLFAGQELSIPPSPDRWVTDKAGFLSPQTVRELDVRLEDFEHRTGRQVIVYIGRTTGDIPIEEWAVRAFEKWGVGRREEDDGLALFIMAEDRTLRIEVGYGLEGLVPDAVASRVIRDILVPQIPTGNQDLAVRQAVDSLLARISGEPSLSSEPLKAPKAKTPIIPMILLGFFGLFVLYLFITHPIVVHRFLYHIMASGGGAGGGGRWRGGGFGGGGFSGGGGLSGGGGASGSW